MMNPKMPKSMSMKIPTPGSGPGAKSLSPIKSGPTVQQPFVSGKRIAKGKTQLAEPRANRSSNAIVKARGTAKIAQGGEKESAMSMSRTNLGRQRL